MRYRKRPIPSADLHWDEAKSSTVPPGFCGCPQHSFDLNAVTRRALFRRRLQSGAPVLPSEALAAGVPLSEKREVNKAVFVTAFWDIACSGDIVALTGRFVKRSAAENANSRPAGRLLGFVCISYTGSIFSKIVAMKESSGRLCRISEASSSSLSWAVGSDLSIVIRRTPRFSSL